MKKLLLLLIALSTLSCSRENADIWGNKEINKEDLHSYEKNLLHYNIHSSRQRWFLS